jgi:hypothetical protein
MAIDLLPEQHIRLLLMHLCLGQAKTANANPAGIDLSNIPHFIGIYVN